MNIKTLLTFTDRMVEKYADMAMRGSDFGANVTLPPHKFYVHAWYHTKQIPASIINFKYFR